MTNEALKHLSEMSLIHCRKKYSNVPEFGLVKTKYDDRNSNGLTKCIIDFLTFKGHHAERISISGRILDERKRVTDVLGHSKTIGQMRFVKSNMTKGTADISATINGRSVKIEVKIGKDKQSEHQLKYQSNIISAGGVYVVAKSFEQFFQWYQLTFETQ